MALRSTHALSLATGSLLLSLVITSGCASTPRGAVDPHLSTAKSKAPEGAELFAQECARCHGDRGQGLTTGPSIIGYGALPEYPPQATGAGNPQLSNQGQVQTQRLTQVPGAPSRIAFKTAADVYQYISTRMPGPARKAGSLDAKQYWDILNFMLISHGIEVPEGGVNESNASSIVIPN